MDKQLATLSPYCTQERFLEFLAQHGGIHLQTTFLGYDPKATIADIRMVTRYSCVDFIFKKVYEHKLSYIKDALVKYADSLLTHIGIEVTHGSENQTGLPYTIKTGGNHPDNICFRVYITQGKHGFSLGNCGGLTPQMLEKIRTAWDKDCAVTFPIGINVDSDTDNEPILLDMVKSPHLLICGGTGSGKSTCLHIILTTLGYMGRNSSRELTTPVIELVDPKNVDSKLYESVKGFNRYTSAKQCDLVLDRAVSEMEKRYKILAKYNKLNFTDYNRSQESTSHITVDGKSVPCKKRMRPYFVIIDEAPAVMGDDEFGEQITKKIEHLGRMSRASGIYLIIALQQPSKESLPTNIKNNLTNSIAFRLKSSAQSIVALSHAGAEKLSGKGAGLFRDENDTKMFQGFFLESSQILKLIERKSHWELKKDVTIEKKVVEVKPLKEFEITMV